MERLSPIELERAQLPTAWRGYEKSVVKGVIGQAAAEIESLRAEVKNLRQEHDRLKVENDVFRRQESALTEALVTAQASAESVRSTARREADELVKKAQDEASMLLRTAHEELAGLRSEMDRLVGQRRAFESAFLCMLEEHTARLTKAVVEVKEPVTAA